MKYLSPILFILIVTSCSKLTNNGPVDGKWQLCEVYSKPEASASHYLATETTNRIPNAIFWNLQLKLLSITSGKPLTPNCNEVVARFALNGSTLHVGPTYMHFRDRDSLITDPNTNTLTPVGINGCEATFQVRRLNGSSMILCSAVDSLVFRKLH